MTWCVLATGASNPPAVMARVRHLPCIAVNNAWADAPWARALMANDAAWWRQHPEARTFAGEKFCGTRVAGIQWLPPRRLCSTHSNSALRALDLAITHYRATRVLLLGVDLTGSHYHPDHPAPLGNPNEVRFALFRTQFDNYARAHLRGIEVLNCSPVSTLACFPKCTLDQALESEWTPESSTAA
jgi:hypothetical protein